MRGGDDMPAAAIEGGVRQPVTHDSAPLHVSGRARYVDDIPVPAGTLEAYIAQSDIAHGRIVRLDLSAVRAAPGVVDVLTARDIPGRNNVGPVLADDPVFADGEVHFMGQPVFAVIARDIAAARAAASRAVIEYEPLPAILTVDEALAAKSYVLEPAEMRRGDAASALKAARHRLEGRIYIGGQDHFYLEGQAALAIPGDGGDMLVHSSTQHPSEVQHLVAGVLGLADHAVTVEVRRMGGGFGGKETQPALFAAIAALGAWRTGCAVKLRLDRDDDMIMTGKRHDFRIDYDVGFDDTGRIVALELMQAARCGYSADLSGAIADRAMFHADNAYYLENVSITSYRCRTNTVSNTAFRGFGGPQGMVGMERIIDHIARHLNLDPLTVRRRNFYDRDGRDITPYGMRVRDNVIRRIVDELAERAGYERRRKEIEGFNAASPVIKRGLALTPVKFGISFTTTHLNQAGALLHLYADGSLHLNHGGTEMGQGLFTKVAQIVAEELQVDIGRIRITATNTGKVPNTSATAASSGSDLNGKAAQNAARKIKGRLIDFAARHFGCTAEQVRFLPNRVVAGNHAVSFDELANLAYLARVPLSATGFYRTPKIHYDRKAARGRPFYYFAYGAAISEVEIDTLTGENRVRRVDILHDVGRSLNPALDRGQIEGGFIQGMGWLTMEELCWSDDGRLLTHAPSTYKIPACGDRPDILNIDLLDNENSENAVHRSKAVGEPPLMLAISVLSALNDAVAAANPKAPLLDAPATPERILMTLNDGGGC